MAYYNYGIIDQNSNPKKDGSVEGFSEVIYAPFTIEINGISYTNPSNDKLRKAGYFPIETRDRIGGDDLLPANYIYFYEGTGNDKKIIKYVYYFGYMQHNDSNAPGGSNNIDSIIGEGGSGGSGGSVDIGDIPASGVTVPTEGSQSTDATATQGAMSTPGSTYPSTDQSKGVYQYPFILNKTIKQPSTEGMVISANYPWQLYLQTIAEIHNRLVKNDFEVYNAISDTKKEVSSERKPVMIKWGSTQSSSSASDVYSELPTNIMVTKNLDNKSADINKIGVTNTSLSQSKNFTFRDYWVAQMFVKLYDDINVDQQIIYNAIREKLLSIKQKIESGNISGGSSDLDTICKSIAFALSNQYSYDIVADYKQSVEMRESEKEYEESQTEETL